MKFALSSLLLLFLSSAILADVSNCRDYWAKNSIDGDYSFSQYANFTENGNTGYANYERNVERSKCQKEWTVLVYMAADNDLSAYAYWDLHEMETQVTNQLNLGASTDSVDILVELDTLKNDGVKRLQIFQTSEMYQESLTFEDYDLAQASFIKSPIVEVLSESNGLSASERFKNFLNWGVKKYPAKHYMVVVWGHGEGFIGQNNEESFSDTITPTLNREFKSSLFDKQEFDLKAFSSLPNATVFPLAKPFGGVAFDHSDKSYLNLPQIQKTLKELKESSLEGSNVDILAFDACLMQSLEVMSELSGEVDFLVGSNQIQNYLGMPYRLVLDELNKGSSPRDFAKTLPELTRKSWQQGGHQARSDKGGFETFTMSSVSSWHMDEIIIPELGVLSQTLLNFLEERSSRKEELMFLIENAPRFQGEMMDLGLFYGLIEQMLWLENLKGENTKLSAKLKKHIVYASEGVGQSVLNATFGPLYYDKELSQQRGGYMLGFFRGLSIWLPKSSHLYQLRSEEMGKSQLHQNVSAWNSVLEKLYSVETFIFDLGNL